MRKYQKHRKTAFLLAAVMTVSSVLGSMGLPVRETAEQGSAPKAAAAEYTPEPTEEPIEWKAIEDAGDLYAIRNDLEGCYYLANDIDLSEVTAEGGEYDLEGHGWDPIDGFKGQLDGRGHRIIGMHIFGEMNDQNVGLFGKTENAVFRNLGIVDCDIDVSGADTVGSLAGYMFFNGCRYDYSVGRKVHRNCYEQQGSYCCYKNEKCFSTGSIKVNGVNNARIGGMIGCSETDGSYFGMTNIYNGCDIQCTSSIASWIGGVLGVNVDYNKLSLSNCYNVGRISAEEMNNNNTTYIGAFLSRYSYRYSSKADVSYTSCFWLDGTAESIQGDTYYTADPGTCKSLTATQMKNQKLFTGFDFDTTWEFDPFCGYPYPQLQSNRQIRPVSLKVKQPKSSTEASVTSGSSVAAPEPVSYQRGEELDIEGWQLEVMYEKAIGEPILLPLTKEMLSGYDMEQEGRQTVTVTYGGSTTSFDILVNPVAVDSIHISDSKLEMYRGESHQLDASVEPANASEKGIIWSSSDDSVVSVDEDGKLTARKRGTVTITAASEADEDVKAVCEVVVQVAANTITLNKTAVSLKIGQRESISVSMLPLDATEKVFWESEDLAVAQIEEDEDGNISIYAVGGGETRIWAMTEKNELAVSCQVTVHGSEENPQVTATPTASPSTGPDLTPTQAPTPNTGSGENSQTNHGLNTAIKYVEDRSESKPTVNSDSAASRKAKDGIKKARAGISQISNVSKRGFRVKLTGKNKWCSGYQLQYAQKSNMKSSKKKSLTGSTLTVKKLKKKKTYYVRVRAFGRYNGKTYYGPWSAKKKIKIRK